MKRAAGLFLGGALAVNAHDIGGVDAMCIAFARTANSPGIAAA